MLILPFQLSPSETYSLFIGFDDEGIDRLRTYDPGVVQQDQLPPEWSQLKLVEVIVGYYTADDQQHIVSLLQDGHFREALRYLTRGFTYKPELGDHDGPAVSLLRRDTDGPP